MLDSRELKQRHFWATHVNRKRGLFHFNPLNPKIKIWILNLLSLFISYRSSGEKLIKYQANSSCVIMSVILITTLFYKALILQGEIWCWSLLGLKGLKQLDATKSVFLNVFTIIETICANIWAKTSSIKRKKASSSWLASLRNVFA